jgi:hypothetical protein
MKIKSISSIIFVLVLFALILSCDDDDEIVEPEIAVCGDVNHDGNITIVDLAILDAYLFSGGSLVATGRPDVDGLYGVTTSDYEYLFNFIYLGGAEPNCTSVVVDSVLPVSSDTLFFEELMVPPGNDRWLVKLLVNNPESFERLTLPIHFDCATSDIVCDSIIRILPIAKIREDIPVFGASDGLIDSLDQIVLISFVDLPAAPSDSRRDLAYYYFSLTSSVDTQYILIDTTAYPPNHFPIMSKFNAPNTNALTPRIVF